MTPYTITLAHFRDITHDPIVTQYGEPDAPIYLLRSGRHQHTNTMLCSGCDTPVRGSFCERCDEWVFAAPVHQGEVE